MQKAAVALICFTLFAANPASNAMQQESDLIAPAQVFVDQLSKGNFDSAVATFDDTMKAVSPPAKLKAVWDALVKQAGGFKARMGVRTERAGQYRFVFVLCQFENESLEIKLVYDSIGRIAGIGFVPSYKAPSYARPEAFTETDVHVGSGEWVLPGTLTVPKGTGPVPALVLVHGSGANDRNESIGPLHPFQDIAWGLATHGVAVLRYDKRTKVYQQKLASFKGSFSVKEETIDDALAAVELLRHTPEIDPKRIFVLGHSLGGMVGPRIAAQDPRLAGLIILAGNTRGLEQLMLAQFDYLISLGGPQAEATKTSFEKIKEQLAKLHDPNTPSTQVIVGAPLTYWKDMDAYNPGEVAASLKMPILVLQGERDYQVTLSDFAGWKKSLGGHSNVKFKTYPKLNHVLMEGEGKSTPDEYAIPGNVAAYVIDDIARWVKSGSMS